MAAPPTGADAELAAMEEMLTSTIAALDGLEQAAAQFDESKAPVLHQEIDRLLVQYKRMQENELGGGGAPPPMVPFGVLQLLDQGKNPDQFMRNYLDNARQTGAAVRGRVQALAALRGAVVQGVDGRRGGESEQRDS